MSDDLLRSLDDTGRETAAWFVAAARNLGLPLVVVSGRRSAAQQAALSAGAGLPKASASTSRHVAGRAFDLGFSGYRWDEVPPEYWRWLGEAWESLGGRWGGRFSTYDPVHFDW